MKERPILFSSPMVRALLDGTKTQTRRIVKDLPPWSITEIVSNVGDSILWLPSGPSLTGRGMASGHWRPCPYGQRGDRLWVRETWGVVSHAWDDDGNMVDWVPDRPATAVHEMPFGTGYYSGHVIYAADGKHEWAGDDDGGGEPRSSWHPSIHMPRRASRITLEITGVRVERLQDISEADAHAEGVDNLLCVEAVGKSPLKMGMAAQCGFAYLWDKINGAGAWGANPWIWVVEFERVTP